MMKLQTLTTVLAAGAMPTASVVIALGTNIALHQPSYAQARGFYCDRT
jgi:hypothetical protein